jgi:glycosyltransferase involved in cell wall biosynthesis
MHAFFSVIIPTYNRAALLGEALDSVFAQEFPDYEVIVIDDGSTDDTAAVAARYGRRVKFLRQVNRGPGAARNRGAQAAHGDYLAFLDSDDLWFPWTLRCYADAIRKHHSPDILLGQTLEFQQGSELSSVAQGTRLESRAFDDFLAAVKKRPIFWGSNYVVLKKKVFVRAGGFREELHVFEDQDLGLRLGAQPHFVKIDAPVTVGYRATPGSLTRDVEKRRDGMLFLLRQEAAGVYPGGEARCWQRRDYLAYSVRSVSHSLLLDSRPREALRLYWQTLGWHLALRRFRFVLGFPLLCALPRWGRTRPPAARARGTSAAVPLAMREKAEAI